MPSDPAVRRRARIGALTGPAGALLCLVLLPVQSKIWNEADSPMLVRAVDPFVQELLGLQREIAPGADAYMFFGRFFVAVYLLCLVGLWAFHHRRADRGGGDHVPRENRWVRVLAIALSIAAVADVGPYWGGLESPFAALFPLEMLALLAIMIGTVGYGIALLRSGSAPRWLGWAFILAAPAALVVAWFSGYFPHGPMLPFTVAVALADVGGGSREPGLAQDADGRVRTENQSIWVSGER